MAATNAIFWTAHGWDGSEGMISKGQTFCTRLPQGKRVKILSATSIKTLIVTLQGVQAIYMVIRGVAGHHYQALSATTHALDLIFLPLSIFGLLRLPAALWLTEDYSYADYNGATANSAVSNLDNWVSAENLTPNNLDTLTSVDITDLPDISAQYNFHPSTSWRSRISRATSLVLILGLLSISLLYTTPYLNAPTFTLTSLLLGVSCVALLTATGIILGIYFLYGSSTTTVIPCIGSRWYKIYTCFLITLMVVLIIVAALETRKSSCGTYTTLSKDYEQAICGTNRGTD